MPLLVLIYWYGASFDHPLIPRWFNFFAGACLWIYMTLDNVDGKQARRTGSSSVLGMIFDHGCDSMVAAFVTIVILQTAQKGGLVLYMIILLVVAGFFIEVVNQRATGVCYLGMVNPVDEGLLILVLLLIGTSITGNQIWQNTILGTGINFFQGLLVVMGVWATFFYSQIIWQICSIKGVGWVLAAVFPFTLHIASVASLWLTNIPVVWHEELYLVLIFALIAGRLIVR